METLHLTSQLDRTQNHFMTTSLCWKLKPTLSFNSTCSASLRLFCNSTSVALNLTHDLSDSPVLIPKRSVSRNINSRSGVKLSEAKLKADWLASLSYPCLGKTLVLNAEDNNLTQNNAGLVWVLGIDPDVSGAVALLKSNDLGCTAQVFDSPQLGVMVGKRKRRRLDAKSIVQLVQNFDVPIGTTAYIEQSTPFPKDGKQGWWGGGFGYGLWIGILVASGFSVIPVPSYTWKKEFDLIGSSYTKDDSRRVASTLFPSLSSELRRKKDHGRAEALLIAAYGNGLKNPLESSFNCISENLET